MASFKGQEKIKGDMCTDTNPSMGSFKHFERISFQPQAVRIPFSNSVEGLGKMCSIQIPALLPEHMQEADKG